MKTPKTDALRQEIPEPRAIEEMIASHADMEREITRLKTSNAELLEALKDADRTLWNLGYENHTPVGEQLRKAAARARTAIERATKLQG